MISQRFETLDAMRGIAAIAVVCFHINNQLQLLAPIKVQHAYLAVDFFFALSGFVIVRAYAGRFDAGLTTWQFFKMRAVRFYPLYLLGTVIGMAGFLLPTVLGEAPWPNTASLAWAIGSSFLMLPGPQLGLEHDFLMPFNTPAWSLIFELGANLLLIASWKFLKPPVLASASFLSGCVLAAQAYWYGSIEFGWGWSNVLLGMDRALFPFLSGVCLAKLYPLATCIRRSHAAWLFLIILMAALVPGHRFDPYYDLACVLFLFPALLYLGASVEPVRVGLFRFLGTISFAIYAIHDPLLRWGPFLKRHLPVLAHIVAPWSGMVVVVFLVGLAWLADILDHRVRRRIRRRLGTPRTAAL